MGRWDDYLQTHLLQLEVHMSRYLSLAITRDALMTDSQGKLEGHRTACAFH